MDTNAQIFSVRDAATFLGIPRSSYYAVIASGAGPVARILNGRRMFLRTDLQEWLNRLPVQNAAREVTK